MYNYIQVIHIQVKTSDTDNVLYNKTHISYLI